MFFSFHHQNDVWRANQVRNSWRHAKPGSREGFGFFDASIWESKKLTSDNALKTLIRDSIVNTSVTCVLAGQATYARRWVRYQIARSVLKGNGLLTVQISNLRNGQGQISQQGPDPLSYMGLYRDASRQVRLAELVNSGWQQYSDYQQAITPANDWFIPNGGQVRRLSDFSNLHCYARNNGAANFPNWVRNAAVSAGR
ncbi:TIR domain-containing protein [Antarctobacter jejuensis]|uniref:TIR domain-containing protein n=1 Tax=Antarctobacter jejuensis TaxID=1439938 RepID=UPI003FCF5B57